jgi:SAM-dependent methyltransferase
VSSNQPPDLFDPRLVAMRLERAARIGKPDAGFLLRHAAAEIRDRVAFSNRKFQRILDHSSVGPQAGEALSGMFPQAEVIVAPIGSHAVAQDAGFDLIVSLFGLHWANDLPGELVRMRRWLKPDGLLMAALPGEGSLSQLREAIMIAETGLTSGAAMRIDPVVGLRQAAQLLQQGGFAMPVTDLETLALSYKDVHSLVRELRAMGATTAMAGKRPFLGKQILVQLEAAYRKNFVADGERLHATAGIIYLSAWNPAEGAAPAKGVGTAKMLRRPDF